jgi:hypothetical protein
MINCPKFVEMLKMFHGKFMIILKVQLVAETQIVITNVNVVDVNVTTRSKVAKE